MLIHVKLVHGYKVKPMCSAIRPSSKISNFDFHHNEAKRGCFSLALMPYTSVLLI